MASSTDRRDKGMNDAIHLVREGLGTPLARQLVAALDAELLGKYPEEGANFFDLEEHQVSVGNGAFFIAFRDGEPVGCGAIRVIDEEAVELKRMYVVPEARGLGVAHVVLRALEEEARRLGRVRICLETGVRQPEAIALYRKHGYAEVPRFGDYPYSPLSLWLGKPLK